jgi:hypothetical protein
MMIRDGQLLPASKAEAEAALQTITGGSGAVSLEAERKEDELKRTPASAQGEERLVEAEASDRAGLERKGDLKQKSQLKARIRQQGPLPIPPPNLTAQQGDLIASPAFTGYGKELKRSSPVSSNSNGSYVLVDDEPRSAGVGRDVHEDDMSPGLRRSPQLLPPPMATPSKAEVPRALSFGNGMGGGGGMVSSDYSVLGAMRDVPPAVEERDSRPRERSVEERRRRSGSFGSEGDDGRIERLDSESTPSRRTVGLAFMSDAELIEEVNDLCQRAGLIAKYGDTLAAEGGGSAPQMYNKQSQIEPLGGALGLYIKALNMFIQGIHMINEHRILKASQGQAEVVSSEFDGAASWLAEKFQKYYLLATQIRALLQDSMKERSYRDLSLLKTPSSDSSLSGTQPQSSGIKTTVLPSAEKLIYERAQKLAKEGTVDELIGSYKAALANYRQALLLFNQLALDANATGDEHDESVLQTCTQHLQERIDALGVGKA